MSSPHIEAAIVRLCRQPRTFEFISQNLRGFDPVELIIFLDRLEKKEVLEHNRDLWTIKEIKSNLVMKLDSEDPQLYLKKYMGYFDFLKTPHPLDFEWRNSTSSLKMLIEEILRLNFVSDKILILGMPTLFATACLKDIPQHVTLVELNRPIVRGLSKLNTEKKRFQIHEADIFTVAPETIGKFNFVIMDPPWYSDHFYQFMWLAAQCLDIGGVLGVSLPPMNTRPNIPEERVKWFKFCQDHGLCLESLVPEKLEYAMPFFEFNAFRAAGVENIQPFWRKGDLAFFRKVKTSARKRPKFSRTSKLWTEKEIDTVRFRIKVDGPDAKGQFIISSILKGDILPTVSTRDTRRGEANIWTSGNRIFSVNQPKKLLFALESHHVQNSKKEKNSVIPDFVKMVTDFEKKEYNNYLDWLYREMESN